MYVWNLVRRMLFEEDKAYFERLPSDLSPVLDAYEHALLATYPRPRYMVDSNAAYAALVAAMPECISDRLLKMRWKDKNWAINQGHMEAGQGGHVLLRNLPRWNFFVRTVWYLWHSIKISAYFSCFEGFAVCPRPLYDSMTPLVTVKSHSFVLLWNKFLATPLQLISVTLTLIDWS